MTDRRSVKSGGHIGLDSTNRYEHLNLRIHLLESSVGGAFVGLDALLTGTDTPAGRPAWFCCASDDVTVVLDTCRDPDERRPLDEPDG